MAQQRAGRRPNTPPLGTPRPQKRCKSGVYIRDITLQDLLSHVHLPSNKAAKALGLGITVRSRGGPGVGVGWAPSPGLTPGSCCSSILRTSPAARPQVFKKLCRKRGIEKWPYQKSGEASLGAALQRVTCGSLLAHYPQPLAAGPSASAAAVCGVSRQ